MEPDGGEEPPPFRGIPVTPSPGVISTARPLEMAEASVEFDRPPPTPGPAAPNQAPPNRRRNRCER